MALTESPRASLFREAFRSERHAKARAPRTPALVVLGRLAGKMLPRWQTVRTNVLALGGLGAISYGAWEYAHWLGYVAGGVSLLVVEMLGGDK